jgi:hypothetical protein
MSTPAGIANWADYDPALVQRGSLPLNLMSGKVLERHPTHRTRQRCCSETHGTRWVLSILRWVAFHLSLCQMLGLWRAW